MMAVESRCKKRVRPAMFPNIPPFLNFLPPGEDYEDGDEPPEELRQAWTMAKGTSPLVVECVARVGFVPVEFSERAFSKLHGAVWDHLLVSEKLNAVNFSEFNQETKINKLPGSDTICRKDKLWTNYKWLQDQFDKKIFGFLPLSFNLPEQKETLQKKLKSNNEKHIWIVKPASASCGYGIKLVTSIKEVPEREKLILSVQKYISNPFLINKVKFDLRLYVLVTSIDPIQIYLYDDGLVRFATEEYTTKQEDLNNKMIHLTNYSVNKNSHNFEFNQDVGQFEGHKWALQTLWRYLETKGYKWEPVWEKIKKICLKTVLCGHFDMAEGFGGQVSSDYLCYKLFGVDILLDENLRPWLLEVNNFPSLEPPSLDRHVNEPMLAEMFNIVGFHLPSKLSKNQRKAVKSRYNLPGCDVGYNGEFYSRAKDEHQKKKEELFTGENMTRERYLSHLMDNACDLTGRDVRLLVQAEQEWSQTRHFCRLMPRADSHVYLNYLEVQNYSDRLLEAWINKYKGEEGINKYEGGREILQKLCRENVHLE